jgi:hypothetical protein
MSRTIQVQEIRPKLDGTRNESRFLMVLDEAFRAAANGRKRVQLREVQAALLARR